MLGDFQAYSRAALTLLEGAFHLFQQVFGFVLVDEHVGIARDAEEERLTQSIALKQAGAVGGDDIL